MSATINAGGVLLKDPQSVEFFQVNWDTYGLTAGVTIASSSFTISGPDLALTKDNESVLSGNRKTQLRLTGGTLGKRYTVLNRIVTNETPAQTRDASFIVKIVNA